MANYPALFVIFLFFSAIVGLIRFQNQPEKVFGVIMLVLYGTNLVTTEQVIASFANKGLLTLILLMVCSLALEKTKLLRLITTFVVKPSYKLTWLRLYGLTALSSGFLNNTAVVSTMLSPIRNNPHHAASKLLLPLSYAAILGGTLTLVGTSTNLIVNSMVLDTGLPPLRFFDFTLIGSLLVLGCGALLYFLSRWLPYHPKSENTATDYFIDAKVLPDSTLIGKTIEANGLRNLESLFLVEIVRQGRLISPVSPYETIQEDDRLLFSGDIKKVTLLNHFDGLSLFAHENGLPLSNLTEVVIRPESILAGKTLKKAGFRALFDAAVVAMKRDGESVSGKLGETELKPGDYLVLAVGEDFKSRHNLAKNFFFISGVETEHLLNGKKELLATAGFFAAILLAAFDVIPLFQGMLLLLGALLMTKCLYAGEILSRLPRQIWLIISAALLLSQALMNTNALDFLNVFIANHQQTFTPLIGLITVYLLTWLLTELVTNNAAAALIFPIAYGLAVSLDSNPHSFIMAVAFGASASFVSPYGYQTNLMVYNAGQYRINDFIKIGLPMSVLYGGIVINAILFFYGV
ncbi:SLC13 family permease [Vibrio sp. sp1]|uniref:SLC13 family permease n=1 Tax=Vibrio TaxID=662 RepID=UPI0019665AF6|nr:MULTISPECIES: SLC13 family permease [Vibrio]MBO0162905.1 SLC13 family permease [Vibrio alginolyticus]MDA0420459.1 SLC13 family permease [Vibrio alginolyticus]MDW2331182.1 SLC13 family permease [Vibrio sp. 1069]QRZ21185.1 SLC13 family permease [Vibrio sp. sp1]HCZ9264364.1 SLC13 family permease [Vibrio alginolyticus]